MLIHVVVRDQKKRKGTTCSPQTTSLETSYRIGDRMPLALAMGMNIAIFDSEVFQWGDSLLRKICDVTSQNVCAMYYFVFCGAILRITMILILPAAK